MGDRYFVPVVCPRCNVEEEAYYAPTCGFVDWKCVCGYAVNLETETGITYEDASNRQELEVMVGQLEKKHDKG